MKCKYCNKQIPEWRKKYGFRFFCKPSCTIKYSAETLEKMQKIADYPLDRPIDHKPFNPFWI